MVGIWSKKLTLQQYLAPLGETEQEQGTMRQENILQPTQLSLHIVYGSLKPPQRVFFVIFSPLRKKTKKHAHYIVQMKNQTEPNEEPKINQFLENETGPNRTEPTPPCI